MTSCIRIRLRGIPDFVTDLNDTPPAAASPRQVNRRVFVGSSVAIGGGLAAAGLLPSCSRDQAPTTAAAPATTTVSMRINGQHHDLEVDTRTSLLDLLREHVGLTGTKKGCDQGACGACTVLLDDRRVLGCLTLAAAAQDAEVTTIEGLEQNGRLHPLQQAFIDEDAFQCGYCTSGQIMSGVGCIREGRAGSPAQIREAMSGNLCRCGAYTNIVTAIARTAGQRGV
jgi:xanthine dehydrogenase YagT iron-sulfur-binding subunit